MSAYFPIPPSISLNKSENKIIGSVTFLNFPNNSLNSIFKKDKYKDIVYLGIYFFRNQEWNLLEIKKCNPREFCEISRSNLDVNDHEMVVLVPKKINIFQKNYNNLPKPDSLKIDNSLVAQRASLNFTYLNSTTSFQGEYPHKMSSLDKGTLLTFDTLKQTNNSSNKNFLILMNISKNNKSEDPVKIKYFNPNNMKEFKLLYAKHNAFSVFETSLYENNIDTSATVFFTSTKSTFIPLMLSLNMKTNQVSVEHTHPPSEYFFGSQKGRYVNLIKKQWIE